MAHNIPSTVKAAYEISPDATYVRTSGGLINSTWIVRDGKRRFVLQRLNAIFDLSVNSTLDKVSAFLLRSCARTTTLVKTINNTPYVLNGKDCWRCLSYVVGETYTALKSAKHAAVAGRALGNFHAAMTAYPERNALPKINVHNLSLHRTNLIAALENHPRHRHQSSISQVAEEILTGIERTPKVPNFPPSILHGDPKVSNFIFDDKSQTACLIDLDTVGQGQLLSELGDAFRSWCNLAGEDTEKSDFDMEIFSEALKGYLSVKHTPLRAEQFGHIGTATEIICLELAARFCADALNETYFGWDKHLFESASEHQLLRARGQLCLAKSVGSRKADILKVVESSSDQNTV